MNLSSGRGSYGLWAMAQIRHIATSTTRPSTSTRSRRPLPRRHSTRLLLSLHLSLSSTSDSSPRSLSTPSSRSSRLPPLPPPPPPRRLRPARVPSSLPGRSPPPAPVRTPRVAVLFVPSPGCLPPPRGPCLVGTPWPRAAPAGCLLKCAKNRGRRPLAALLL
jgi:hypothetical protein